MKNWLVLVSLIPVKFWRENNPHAVPASGSCVAQQPSAKEYQWKWKEAQSLGGQTVSTAKQLSTAERQALLAALAAQFRGVPNSTHEARQTRVAVLDLNGDGVPEVLAQPIGDLCSPTGNCPFWGFQKTGTTYRLILQKGSAQTFTIQPTRTNGYFDLVLGMHGSATEQSLFVYRFRDGRYQRTDCYEANWTYLGKDGEYHDLKEPRITPCKK